MKKVSIEHALRELAMNGKSKYWVKDPNRFGWKRGKLFISMDEVINDKADHTCYLCKTGEYDMDIRWFRMSCLYAMEEAMPYLRKVDRQYLLPVCKEHRGFLMRGINDLITAEKNKG